MINHTMIKLAIVRHGQSEFNESNTFTGWEDPDLTELGIKQAQEAGKKLQKANLEFDIGFTSVLTRAVKTLYYILEETNQLWLPVRKSWRLNERHYGALQRRNKDETAEEYGEEQVHLWRRSYDIPPPLQKEEENQAKNDRRYALLDRDAIPAGESLKMTLERVTPYWMDNIVPLIKQGRHVIIAAHGNSLRALIKHLENLSDEAITDIEIPTGVPLIYELDDEIKPVDKYFLDG